MYKLMFIDKNTNKIPAIKKCLIKISLYLLKCPVSNIYAIRGLKKTQYIPQTT